MKTVASGAVLLTLVLPLFVMQSLAQPAVDPPTLPEAWPTELTGPRFASVVEKVQRLGPWEEQARWITSAHEAIWQRNGWTSEADENARRLVSAIESLPPWRLDQRLDMFCKLTTERYGLDEDQQRALRSQLIRETVGFMTRYAPTLLKNANLVLDRRANGSPLDPQTVAQMVSNARPIIEEFSPEIDRILDEFEAGLTEQQRETFRRDREAFERRREVIQANLDRWSTGQWSPTEWGLDKDPLYAASNQPVEIPVAPANDPSALPSAPFESAWQLYVRQFIRRYDLDAAQQRAAWAVLNDVQRRAAREWVRLAEGTPTDADPLELQRRRDAAIEPLFEELVDRLEQIPTPHQRRVATPQGAAERE